MLGHTDVLTALGLFLVLAVCPGGWIAFGLVLRDFAWHERVAIGIALSPAVVGVQLLALKLAGAGFPMTAAVVLAANAVSILLIYRVGREAAPRWRPQGHGLAIATVCALVATLLVPWLLIPSFRTFAWHSLMHVDTIYELVRSPGLPGDAELAGLAPAYPWIGHAAWAIAGWAGDVAPMALFPLTNLLWLVVAAVLVYSIAIRACGLHPAAAAAAVALANLGGQVLPLAAQLVSGDATRWREHFVLRASPILEKYRGFETMPFGVALVAAIFLVSSLGVTREIRHRGVLLACLLSSLALVYPLLYPVGLAAALTAAGLLLARTTSVPRSVGRREAVAIFAATAVSLAFFAVALRLYVPSETATSPLVMAGRKARFVEACVSLAFLAIVAAPGAIWAIRRRHVVLLFAMWLSACVASAYVLVDAGGLEYKYVTIAALFMAPVAAKSLELCFRRPRGLTVAALVTVSMLVSLDLAWFMRLRVNVPANLAAAPRLKDAGFWLGLDPAEPESGWVEQVRATTPPETVVVARNARIHLGPFLQRSLYAPADADGDRSAGYSVPTRAHLVRERRYPPAFVDGRMATADRLVNPGSLAELTAALGEVLALGRPVAIHYPDPPEQVLQWLRQASGGRQLWQGRGGVVWLADPVDSRPSRSAEGQREPGKSE